MLKVPEYRRVPQIGLVLIDPPRAAQQSHQRQLLLHQFWKPGGCRQPYPALPCCPKYLRKASNLCLWRVVERVRQATAACLLPILIRAI